MARLPSPLLYTWFTTSTPTEIQFSETMTIATTQKSINTPRQVLFASLIGTTIEFFDFYIYATAAVLVFPRCSFRRRTRLRPRWPRSRRLASRSSRGRSARRSSATSATASAARPRWSWRCPRWVCRRCAIGSPADLRTIGFAAPLLLALCRFGQGLGLGGEWGGAVLLAIENAPPGKRAWYGMFPQLGAPSDSFFPAACSLVLSHWLTDKQFFAFGWRLPFLASAVLVLVGLYVRLTITETPVFQAACIERPQQVKVPMLTVFRDHRRTLVAGILVCLATFVLFYLMTVFALVGHSGAALSAARTFLLMQFFGIAVLRADHSAFRYLAERGRRPR